MFSIVSSKFRAVSDSHLQMSTTATMAPGSAVVLFSYSGATTSGLQVLELAKKPGHFHHSGYPVPQVSGGHPGGCGAALRLQRRALPVRFRTSPDCPAGGD